MTALRRPPAPARPARSRPRGAALLVVMVSLAVLTAFAVDLAYETRVTVQTSVNGRDELRALYEAKGAVALARLVLSFQAQVDQATSAMGASPQLAATAPRIKLWSLVPVNSGFASLLFGGGGGAEPGPPRGAFEAKLEDESAKVNAQLDGLGALLAAQLAAFFDVVGDRKWDFLFDREDENGLKVTRNDLAIYLHDWVDPNNVTSGLTGDPARPFEDAFGDENYAYDRGPDRYRAKNARFDSLDELYLVAGVTDAFMAAFGDQLTVYTDKNAPLGISSELKWMIVVARVMAGDAQGQAAFSDATFAERLQKAASDASWGGVRALQAAEFADIIKRLGVIVDATKVQQGTDRKAAFGPSPGVYRVRAQGTAGDVTKVVDAVVTMDPSQIGTPPSQIGRLLHWRED